MKCKLNGLKCRNNLCVTCSSKIWLINNCNGSNNNKNYNDRLQQLHFNGKFSYRPAYVEWRHVDYEVDDDDGDGFLKVLQTTTLRHTLFPS